MAAERLATAGATVTVYEQMASVGRKFLLAGRGGLNLTHSEPTDQLIERYGNAAPRLRAAIEAFDTEALRAWAADLGEATFVGTSGRVFPEHMRATPLLRAWLARLNDLGVMFRMRTRWTDLRSANGRIALSFVDTRTNADSRVEVDGVVLALGGASWPGTGSDGQWCPALAASGVQLAAFRPANCGFRTTWSDVFVERFAGSPLKNVRLAIGQSSAQGDGIVTASGVEGGAFYAVGAAIRDTIKTQGHALVTVDLRPDLAVSQLNARLGRTRSSDSIASQLRKVGLVPVEIGLLREATANALPHDQAALSALIKAVPLQLTGVMPIERAISTAGGIRLAELDEDFMLRRLPGVFAVGEMLDWEAPTGGYLLQATFSSAVAAANGLLRRL